MGLFGLSSPESKVMSSFTTNLLIKLRLIKALKTWYKKKKKKRLYNFTLKIPKTLAYQAFTETCRLNQSATSQWSRISLENAEQLQQQQKSCWNPEGASRGFCQGCSPSSCQAALAPSTTQSPETWVILHSCSSCTRGLGSPDSPRWVQLGCTFLLTMLLVLCSQMCGQKGDMKGFWKEY